MATSAVADPNTGDRAAVTAVPQRIIAAWAAHDAEAFADTFTDDGTMILPGVYRKGRDDIRDFMAAGFAGPYRGSQVTGTPLEVRFLSADTGVLISHGGVLEPGQTELPVEKEVHALWLVVKRDDVWRLAAYQNCPAH